MILAVQTGDAACLHAVRGFNFRQRGEGKNVGTAGIQARTWCEDVAPEEYADVFLFIAEDEIGCEQCRRAMPTRRRKTAA